MQRKNPAFFFRNSCLSYHSGGGKSIKQRLKQRFFGAGGIRKSEMRRIYKRPLFNLKKMRYNCIDPALRRLTAFIPRETFIAGPAPAERMGS